MIDESNGYPLISEYFVCATDKTIDSKWRRIVVNGEVTRYEMNKDDIVRNVDSEKELRGFVGEPGYCRYLLTINGEKKYF